MFDKSFTIIRDASKLSFDYVPVDLINRDTEMGMLETMMRPVVEYESSETAFVTGNVGSGKTATVKRFCMDMLDHCSRNNIPFTYIFVNCRQKTTDSAVLLQMIRYYDRNFPDKGFSPAEMLQILRTHIVRSGKRTLIVLDEVDSLIKHGPTNLIYQITRFSDDENSKVSLSLILISQEYVLDRLDKASLSTFKRANTIRFSRYTKSDLISITEARARMALVDATYDDTIIDFIADIASESGDARIAIDLLDKSARFAENGTAGAIMAEDVRLAMDMMCNALSESKLADMKTNRLLALLAVARCIRKKAYVVFPEIQKTYAVVCEEYEVPAKGHTQLRKYISDLESDGMVKTVRRFDSEHGTNVTFISLPDVPANILAKKIEKILEEDGDASL